MTKAEKFEEVFGIKIDDYPSDICDIAHHKYCNNANSCHDCVIFKFWKQEYVESGKGNDVEHNMTRVEENNIMMERIYKDLNRYPFPEKIEDVGVDPKTLTFMDMSRSLAIIADKLNTGIIEKEENNGL